MTDGIEYRDTKQIPKEGVLRLYQANNWSSAEKPDQLYKGLLNSHCLITAWDGEQLVGLANAISDGALAVYFPHAVVLPEYQRKGIGRQLMTRLMSRYAGFHQQSLLSDKDAVGFYEKLGFRRAGNTQPMWIFDGTEH